MANAFYSLYSHVSRTPLQKLAPPEFSFVSSPVERMERFRSSVRSEPRSPVERLKDTVSKMCLYTGSPRGSDSSCPQSSPKKRSSISTVSDLVLEKVKSGISKRLDLKECDRSQPGGAVSLTTDGDGCCDGVREEKRAQQSATCTDAPHSGIHHDPGVRTSLSEDSVTEANHPLLSCQSELDSSSTQSEPSNAELKPAAKVACDVTCPQIAECEQEEPFCIFNRRSCSETEHRDKPCVQSDDGDSAVTTPLPALASRGCLASCRIGVTYCEGHDIPAPSQNAPDSSHTSTVPPVRTCEESFNGEKSRCLNPSTRHIYSSLAQVNSFELEEVQDLLSMFRTH